MNELLNELEEIKLKEFEDLKVKLNRLSDVVKALAIIQRWTFDYADNFVSANVTAENYNEKVAKGVSAVRKELDYVKSLTDSL
jgi:hypothetical protein